MCCVENNVLPSESCASLYIDWDVEGDVHEVAWLRNRYDCVISLCYSQSPAGHDHASRYPSPRAKKLLSKRESMICHYAGKYWNVFLVLLVLLLCQLLATWEVRVRFMWPLQKSMQSYPKCHAVSLSYRNATTSADDIGSDGKQKNHVFADFFMFSKAIFSRHKEKSHAR